MITYLVNFAYLDPPQNGGVNRLARDVATALLTEKPVSSRVVFVVRMRFISQFKNWLGVQQNIPLIPYSRYIPIRTILRLIRPNVIINPLFGIAPFVQPSLDCHITSLPDTLILDHPELFSPAEIQSRRKAYLLSALSKRIITLSTYARNQLLHHLPLTPEQVQSVELGADGLPSPSPYSLIRFPYIFYPANTWLHKRHELLLQTMALIWKNKPDLKLVLSGGRPTNFDLQRLIAQYAPPGAVFDMGYITDMQVSTLYHHAEALLFTSQYEGFGMPILEAMHAGCPVICAPVTAIPEVAGDAALYVNSDKPEDWANAFLDQLPSRRAELVEHGYKRAAQFTWEQTRRKWLNAVLSVVGESPVSD